MLRGWTELMSIIQFKNVQIKVTLRNYCTLKQQLHNHFDGTLTCNGDHDASSTLTPHPE